MNIRSILSCMAGILVLATPVISHAWTTPRDSNGWSQIAPSSDSRLIYVDASAGNNSTAQTYTIAQVGNVRNPQISIAPYQTLSAAKNQLRNGYPDWILLKRGQTWTDQAINLRDHGSGRSASERMVITYYGTSGDRPVLEINGGPPITSTGGGTFSGLKNNWAFIGISSYIPKADPDNSAYVSTFNPPSWTFLSGGSNILFEDCKFHSSELVVQGLDAAWHNIEIRRNIVVDVFWHGSTTTDSKKPSGLYVDVAHNVLIEENNFDRNGWHTEIADAGANMFNHNIYIQNGCTGLIVKGNILSRGSSHGIQLRPGGIMEKNIAVRNAIAFLSGGGTNPEPGGVLIHHKYNVAIEGRYMDPNNFSWPRTSSLAGIDLDNFNSSGNHIVEECIIANRYDGTNGQVHAFNSGYYNASNLTRTDNIVYAWKSSEDQYDSGWSDPDRTISDYMASIGETATNEAWYQKIRNRPIGVLSWDHTAYAMINYIRAGFNMAPISGEYNYPGSSAVAVTGVSVSPSTAAISGTGTSQLSADISPSNATNQNVNWSSANTAIATVNSSGLVTGVSPGVTTITATTQDGSFTDTCTVTVQSVAVTGVSVSPGSASLNPTQTIQLNASVSPSNATDPSVSWSSDDTNVATVSSSGLVTAVAAGSANITATTNSGSYTDSASITVSTTGGTGGTGEIRRDYWTGITGFQISNLTGNSNYPDNPTGSDTLSSFEAVSWDNPSVTQSWADNYGQRIYGYLYPPTTGTYTFWIAGDDYCDLRLSTDSNPANAVSIASVSGWTYQQEWDKYSSQKSVSVTLNANQAYYIEALHKESTSGDRVAVGWAKPGESTSVPSEVIPGTYLSPDLIVPVTDENVAENKSVTASAWQDDMDGYQPPAYLVDGNTGDSSRWSASGFSQWAIIDLGSMHDINEFRLYPYLSRAYQYTIEASTNGSSYSTVVDRSTNTESDTVLTDTAAVTARYIRLTVTGASGYTGSWVSINELEVYGVPATEYYEIGSINRDYWTSVSGMTVANLTGNSNYPDSPTGSDTLTSLQAVNWSNPSTTLNWADNYGQRIFGFLHPPASGNYTFWIASDDQSELYLSTTSDPANAVLIAYNTGWTSQNQWNKYSSQKSATVQLDASEVYYIEVIHKESTVGDNLSVGWAKPGESTSAPSEIVPGSSLSPWFIDN